MTLRTRVVYFISDPYSDARLPVAAMLQNGDNTGVVRAAAPALKPAAQSAVERALADIEDLHDFDALPIGAGPQFIRGEPRVLPAGVAATRRWVLDNLLRAA